MAFFLCFPPHLPVALHFKSINKFCFKESLLIFYAGYLGVAISQWWPNTFSRFGGGDVERHEAMMVWEENMNMYLSFSWTLNILNTPQWSLCSDAGLSRRHVDCAVETRSPHGSGTLGMMIAGLCGPFWVCPVKRLQSTWSFHARSLCALNQLWESKGNLWQRWRSHFPQRTPLQAPLPSWPFPCSFYLQWNTSIQ